MSRTVDYRSVIGRLTDAIKELNQPHAKDPTESAKRVAEERRRDAAKLLRALLRALEQKPVASGAAPAAGAAGAEHGAGALRGLIGLWGPESHDALGDGSFSDEGVTDNQTAVKAKGAFGGKGPNVY